MEGVRKLCAAADAGARLKEAVYRYPPAAATKRRRKGLRPFAAHRALN